MLENRVFGQAGGCKGTSPVAGIEGNERYHKEK